jgi:hypothetical protein
MLTDRGVFQSSIEHACALNKYSCQHILLSLLLFPSPSGPLIISMPTCDQHSAFSREELRQRLHSAETVIAEQRKLLYAKENMCQRYMQQFNELTAN